MDSWKDAEIAFEVKLNFSEARALLRAMELYAPKAYNLMPQAGQLERFLRCYLNSDADFSVLLVIEVTAKETLVMKKATRDYCVNVNRNSYNLDIYRELCRVTNEQPKI